MIFPETGTRGHRPLLDTLCNEMTREDLEIVARADYGIDATENSEAIYHILRSRKIPTPLDWIPREALELVRWSEPEHEPDRLRAHLRRAFASMIVFHADIEDGCRGGSIDATAAVMTESIHHLGSGFTEPAAEMVAWAIHREKDVEDLPFLGLAFFSLSLPNRKRWNDHTIMQVAEWVMDREDESSKSWINDYGMTGIRPWLLTGTSRRMRDHVWRRIGADLALLSRNAGRSRDVTNIAELFGAMMAG